jgi:hypothetical protein
MIEIGVAKPNAHGQAIISTVTDATTAWVIFGSKLNQIKKVIIEITITTGTNTEETLSTKRPLLGLDP